MDMYINNCNVNAIQNTQMIYNENEYFTFKIHGNMQSIIQNIVTLSYSTE